MIELNFTDEYQPPSPSNINLNFGSEGLWTAHAVIELRTPGWELADWGTVNFDFTQGPNQYEIPPPESVDFQFPSEGALAAYGIVSLASKTAELEVSEFIAFPQNIGVTAYVPGLQEDNPIGSGSASVDLAASLHFPPFAVTASLAVAKGGAPLTDSNFLGEPEPSIDVTKHVRTALAPNWYMLAPTITVFRGAYEEAQDKADRSLLAEYDPTPAKKEPSVRGPWGKAKVGPEVMVKIPWGDLPKLDQHTGLVFRDLERWLSTTLVADYDVDPPEKDRHRRQPWGETIAPVETFLTTPYIVPAKKDHHHIFPWDTFSTLDWHFALDYSDPPEMDWYHVVEWGPVDNGIECIQHYRPRSGGDLLFSFNEGIDGPSTEPLLAFDKSDYDEECYELPPHGNTDAYNPTPPPPEDERIPVGNQEVYRIMASVKVTLVSDGSLVQVNGVSTGIDIDNWAWKFKLTLASDAELPKINPATNGGPVAVKIEMNGYTWTTMIEGFDRSRKFGKIQVTASGRSYSAELAAPYTTPDTNVYTSDMGAYQTVRDQLQYTDWTVNWNTNDWTIPGGVYSYEGKTSMNVIKEVVESVGAFVHPDTANREFTVAPRYHTSPKNWGSLTPDKTIPEDLMVSTGMTWKPDPVYNIVYVSGKNQGVLTEVTRDGTAGDKPHDMIVNALVTDSKMGRERGRNVLDASGDKAEIDVEMPLTTYPDLPGLILPGEIIEMTDNGTTFKALVLSTDIKTVRSNSSLTVTQSLTVERHY